MVLAFDISIKSDIILPSFTNQLNKDIKMEENYLSVKEFANMAGVRTQRIYQMLDKDLQRFCKSLGKYKKINAEALQLFGKSLQEKTNENSLVIKTLVEQIEIKDKQLANKDNQIFELQNTIKSLQEQQTILTKSLANSQALHAGTIKEHIDSKAEKRGIFYWLFHFRRQK